jgi:RNA polymerase sigma-70 factor (ECF subfamily)
VVEAEPHWEDAWRTDIGKLMSERGAAWFTAVYRRHYPDVVRYGLRRQVDVDSSAELAQEVFAVAWRRRDQVPDNSLPWLYGVARRLLANHWRARRIRPAVAPITGALPAQQADHPDSIAALAELTAALARLTETDQEILRLIGWEQLSLGAAATVLGCSYTAAKVRMHRARRHLAAVLSAAPAPPAEPPAGLVRGTQHAQY